MLSHRLVGGKKELTGHTDNANEVIFTIMSCRRFKIACRMLRGAGLLERKMPGQKISESTIDFLVRCRIAEDPHSAAEALIAGARLTAVLDELEALPDLA